MPSLSGLDSEVGDLAGLAGDALLAGLVAELLDGHVVEALHHLLLHVVPDRAQHLHADFRTVGLAGRIDGALELAHDADDLADRDASPLAGKAVASSGAALAGEDAVVDALLQPLPPVAPWHPLPPRDVGPPPQARPGRGPGTG